MATLSPPSPTTTALPTEARSYPVGHEPVHNYLREPRPADDVRGLARAWAWIKSWALSVDHKRIGIMYLVAVSVFFRA